MLLLLLLSLLSIFFKIEVTLILFKPSHYLFEMAFGLEVESSAFTTRRHLVTRRRLDGAAGGAPGSGVAFFRRHVIDVVLFGQDSARERLTSQRHVGRVNRQTAGT